MIIAHPTPLPRLYPLQLPQLYPGPGEVRSLEWPADSATAAAQRPQWLPGAPMEGGLSGKEHLLEEREWWWAG